MIGSKCQIARELSSHIWEFFSFNFAALFSFREEGTDYKSQYCYALDVIAGY